jgi:hypothetical protein
MDREKVKERRDSVRQEVDRKVDLVLPEGRLTGRLRNLSREGMLVGLDEGLRVRVQLDRKEVAGTIVRVQAVDASEWALGIRLDDEVDPEIGG